MRLSHLALKTLAKSAYLRQWQWRLVFKCWIILIALQVIPLFLERKMHFGVPGSHTISIAVEVVWYVGWRFCIGLLSPSLSRDQHWLCNTSPHGGASPLLSPPTTTTLPIHQSPKQFKMLTWCCKSWRRKLGKVAVKPKISANIALPLFATAHQSKF